MPYPLDNLDVVFWDFDGVILDSMEIRDLGFEKIFEDFPKKNVDQLLNYHRVNGGLSRYVKIEYFFKEIVQIAYTQEDILAYASSFSDVMRLELPNPKYLIHDALNFIKQNYSVIPFHIVSGSDQKELRFLCDELNLTQYFKSIHGSPTPKIELVKSILEEKRYAIDRAVLIGDSINDFDAAKANSIGFSGYNNESLREKGKYIDNFS